MTFTLDTRLAMLLLWGGGTVAVYAIVFLARFRRWRKARFDRRWVIRADSRRDVISAFALLITAFGAAGAIAFVLFGEAGSTPRGLAIALALGAFLGAGLIMASEDDDPSREVDTGDNVSPPYDAAGDH